MSLFLYKCANAHDLLNCNKLDMARNFIASSVSDLEAAGRSASATHFFDSIINNTSYKQQ